jgi:transposase
MSFVRVVETKSSTGKIHQYVRIVESRRKKGKVKQEIVANLGNIQTLRKDIKKIVNGLLRAVGEVQMVSAQDCSALKTQEFGVRYVTEAVWKELELDLVIQKQLASKRTALDYQQWIRMMVINKLSDPKSKLGIFDWLKGVWWPDSGFDERILDESADLQTQQSLCKAEAMKFYRAMDYLLPMKEEIETHLYYRLRNLFSMKVDLVFYDVTSSYFEGSGPQDFAALGYSRDKKPGKKQIVIGLIMCDGLPIGHEVFQGNRLDRKTVRDVLKKLKEQFSIHRCIFVGDRGMVSRENLAELEQKGFDSILALKKRRNKEVKKLLLQSGPLMFCRESVELEWCEVAGNDGIRYLVCRNPVSVEGQKEKRERDLGELESKLNELTKKVQAQKRPAIKTVVKQVEEILSHKKGRRFLNYQVDEKTKALTFWRKEEAIELEEALDGVYILRTKKEKLKPMQIIKGYRGLCDVERAFRTMKSVLELRPFYHQIEDRVKAHAFICFLAYLMEKYVERILKTAGIGLSGEKAFGSLSNMGVAVMKIGPERFSYVTRPTSLQSKILKALKIKTPQRDLYAAS